MFKKINFTGKRRLLWKGDNPEILANLDEISPYEAKLLLVLELDKYLKTNSDAKVSLEIYQARLSVKKELGSVSDVCKHTDDYEFDTDDLEPSKLRLRIKISEKETGKIIAYADRIKPETVIKDEGERKKRESFQSSIFILRTSSQIEVPYTVDIQANDRPIILCNDKLNFREKLSQDAKLQYILLPTILRETYYRYILDEEFHNDRWFLMLVDFGERLIERAAITRDEDGKVIFNDEVADWINDVCNTFSTKNKFINQLDEIFKREA